jgi:Lrp/AsnC family leucine-responsive transcriptional regulator
MRNMVSVIASTPQIVRCECVSGEDCFVAWAHVRDVAEMEAVIDRLVPYGATNSAVVQSTPLPERSSGFLAGGFGR